MRGTQLQLETWELPTHLPKGRGKPRTPAPRWSVAATSGSMMTCSEQRQTVSGPVPGRIVGGADSRVTHIASRWPFVMKVSYVILCPHLFKRSCSWRGTVNGLD
jgi:hypothetical protein